MPHPVALLNESLLVQILTAAVVGIASHLGYYKQGEHHMKSPLIAQIYLIFFVILLLYQIQANDRQVMQGASKAFLVSASYTVSLLTSISVYRTYLHRLCGFPGPFMASISKIWHTLHVLDSKNHILLERLHEQYGDFVRTGTLMVLKAEEL